MKSISILAIISIFASALFSIFLFSHNALYIIGGEYILPKGETLNGDLNLLFARATLEEEAHVNGHVFALSSDVNVKGIVEQDIVTLESKVHATGMAQIHGKQTKWTLFDYIVLIPELNHLQISH